MKPVLLHPTYFPQPGVLACLLQREVVWEVWDNFQKQTFRNRCYICTDRGRLMLNIPIRHVGGTTGRQRYREVEPDNSYPWQRQHWRTLETAYRSAPFFEYYEAELRPLFETAPQSLLEWNLESTRLLCDLLGIPFPEQVSGDFQESPTGVTDGRHLVLAKGSPDPNQPPYHQVFEDRHGFIPGVSTLDLLFNEGPAALDYIQNLKISVGA